MQPAISQRLAGSRQGNRDALDALSSLVYRQLKRMAAHQLRGQAPGHTLQPTALVHEVYLRLAHWDGIQLKDRAHFLAIAGRLMRQVLVEHARFKNAGKRGGRWNRLTIREGTAISADGALEVIALDDALQDLARTDPRKSRIVEMRFFGGLTEAEIADLLELSVTTIGREMRLAMAWLYRYLKRAS